MTEYLFLMLRKNLIKLYQYKYRSKRILSFYLIKNVFKSQLDDRGNFFSLLFSLLIFNHFLFPPYLEKKMLLPHNLYIITGANRGFGKAIAETIAAESKFKTSIVLVGRNKSQLESIQLTGKDVTSYSIGDARLDSAIEAEKTVIGQLSDLLEVSVYRQENRYEKLDWRFLIRVKNRICREKKKSHQLQKRF
jgi:hypothetical protein